MATKKNEAYVEFKANTAEFNKGIKNMNAELKNATNALRLNATQLKGAGDSVDLLSERQNILQNELEASKKKVELTERSLAECKATLGENSKEYQSLSNAVLAAKNQQQAIQNELEQTAAKLDKITQENKEAATSFGKLANEIEEQESDLEALKREYTELVLSQGKGSKEAKDLAKQISSLSSELIDNKKKMSEAEGAADKLDKSLDDLENSAKDAGEGFTIAKGALANFIGSGLSGLATAAGNTVQGLAGLADETREYRAEMGKLDVAFAEGGYTTEQAKNTYKDFYAVLGDEGQTVEAVSHLAKLTNSQKELDQWTTICTGVYGTFGNSLPIESLTEAANETAKVGTITGSLADALNWAGVSEDDFNAKLEKCSSEQERQKLITSTLNGLYGEAANKYRETNGAIMEANAAQSDYSDTMASFGEKVEPITTTVKEGFNGLLQEVLELTEGADIEGFTSAIQSGFATVKDTVLPAVVEGFGKLKEAWQWLSEHTGLLVTIASIIGIVTTAITAYNVVQGIKTAMDAANVTTVWALVAAHIAQAAAAMAAIAPYLLIVAAIAAVIAIIVLCVKHWDTIKEKITEVAENIKNKVIEIKNNIAEKFNEAKQKVTEIFENIKNAIAEKITAAKETLANIFETIKNVISVALQFIVNLVKGYFNLITLPFRFIWENCKEYVFAAFEWIKEKINTAIAAIKNIVQIGFNFVKEKIIAPITAAKNKVVEIFNNIRTAISEKITAIREKVTAIFNSIKEKIVTPITAAKNKVVEIFNNIRTAISEKITAIKTKVTSIFNSIKEKITTPINNAKAKVVSTLENLKSSFFSKVEAIKNKVTSTFNNIKTKMLQPVEQARDKIKGVVDKIKGFFNNMKLKFPKIKMPHFSIKGKFSLDPPSVPKLAIDWYAKGGFFNKPTVLSGLGEAGPEYALPLNERSLAPLAVMLNKLTMQGENGLADVLASRFDAAIDKLADRLEKLEMAVNIDGERVATATASYNDTNSGLRAELAERGLSLG